MDARTLAIWDEQRLTRRAADDPAAFCEVYDRYYARVYNYVRYRVSDPEQCNDLVATILSRAFEHIGTYRPDRGPFVVWLLAIARNAVNDWLRRRGRAVWQPLDTAPELAAPQPTPEEALLRRERHIALIDAISRLDERARDLLALKFAAGLTNRRIAELTGLTESNVGVIVFRAVRKLRRTLEENGGHA